MPVFQTMLDFRAYLRRQPAAVGTHGQVEKVHARYAAQGRSPSAL